MADTESGTVREAVGVFHDAASLEGAIDELLTHGFDRAHLSLVAGRETVEQTLHHAFTKVAELEDDAEVPRIAYISRESLGDAEGGLIGGLMYVGAVAAAGGIVASGGAVAGALLAAALAGGAGGFIGSTLARMLDEHHAKFLHDQLDRGGILLWVRTVDEAHEERAKDILNRHSAGDVHVHTLPAPARAVATPG